MADVSISLLPWQETVWNDPTRFKVIAAGRRSGKSRYAAYRLLVEALQCDKGYVFYVAPTQSQARDIMWKVLQDIGKDVIESCHINNLHINLINGATIALKGGDRPDTMRGVSLKFCVVDEYAQIKPFIWEEVLRPALADQRGDAVFIGTPEGRNHFYDLYEYAASGTDAEWKAWHFTSYDNPILEASEIDAAKRSMSSYAFRKEFLASFAAQGSDIFQEKWVTFSGEEPKGPGDFYIAVDLAGFEEVGKTKSKKSQLDDTAISIVKVMDDGKWWVQDIIYGRWDLNSTANEIFKAVDTYRPVAVGLEKGIAQQAVLSVLEDLMRRRQKFFRVQLLTHGNKKKSDRIIWALQGRMEHGFITFNDGEYVPKFLDQLFNFPSSLVKDDLIDSLAYIEQLAVVPYWSEWPENEDPYESLDKISGY
jgi:phage terminase large subunit-like protein